jgi:diguanylate cyclase (GGDEF)-like protein
MSVAAVYPSKSPRAVSSLARVVLGQDSVQRRAVKRLLLISHAYAVIWFALGLSINIGYAPPSVWLLVIYGVIGQSTFYILLRGGYTLHLKDPLFCFPQALFGVGAVVIGYALIPYGQGASLQVLFVLLVYDLHRLSPRQIGIVSGAAVVALSSLVGAEWVLGSEGVDLRQESLNIGMAVIVILMLSAVSGAVRRVHIHQLEQKAELDKVLSELRTLSEHDALTGAANRRHMMALLNEELKRQRRAHRPFSVAMIDIDFFKRVNDDHGHAVGDLVLKQLVLMTREALRETDVVARWGGEEFLVLLPLLPVAAAAAAVDNLRQRVEQHNWTQYAAGLQVTFSSGVAEHELAVSLEQTIERADGALYRAKEHGRNRVEQA